MIVDYRIYCTAYLLCFLVYCVSALFVGSKWWLKLFGAALIGAVLVASINYLDWLWS